MSNNRSAGMKCVIPAPTRAAALHLEDVSYRDVSLCRPHEDDARDVAQEQSTNPRRHPCFDIVVQM